MEDLPQITRIGADQRDLREKKREVQTINLCFLYEDLMCLCSKRNSTKNHNHNFPFCRKRSQSSYIFPFTTRGNLCWLPSLPLAAIKSIKVFSG